MNKQETITKLKEIKELLTKHEVNTENLDSGLEAKYKKKFKKIKEKAGELQDVPSVFSNMFYPFLEKKYNYVNEEISCLNENVTKYKNKRNLYNIIFMCSVVLLFILVVFSTIFGINESIALQGTMLLFVSIITMIVFCSLSKKTSEKLDPLEKYLSDLCNQYTILSNNLEKLEKNFPNSMKNFEIEKQNGYKAALKYGEIVTKANDDFLKEIQNWKNEIEALKEDCKRIDKELEKYDFMPKKYYRFVSDIIDLLESGRADEYKEALNIAIAEERENEERTARMYEEEERTALMRQQAEEEKRHNRQMELEQAEANRIQVAHNREMENAERQREQQRIRDQKYADSQARDARRNANEMARRRCQSCKKAAHCNMSFKGMENCGAFEPR